MWDASAAGERRIAVLLGVRIPMPAKTGGARETAPAVWRQVFEGFRHLAERPVLLGVCAYVSITNFIAGRIG